MTGWATVSTRCPRKILRVADSSELIDVEVSALRCRLCKSAIGRLLGLDHHVPEDWSDVSAPGHINKYALFIG